MPTLVHLADERETASIQQNGLKIGKNRPGIFCMPVMQNYYLSHQWLRELKRRGIRTFVAVYFKLPSDTPVLAGKYNEGHKKMSLGAAIQEIQGLKEPLGYELIVDRKIEAKAIEKVKGLSQNIGWRYMPGSHLRKPCACDYCIKGGIKANRVREKLNPRERAFSFPEILQGLRNTEDVYEIGHWLDHVRSKRRRTDPRALAFLLDKNSTSIDQDLAIALQVFRHPASRLMLLALLEKPDAATREYAADSLLTLYGQEAAKALADQDDEVIRTALKNWQEK